MGFGRRPKETIRDGHDSAWQEVSSLHDGHDFDGDDEDVKGEEDEKGEKERADETDTTKRRRRVGYTTRHRKKTTEHF